VARNAEYVPPHESDAALDRAAPRGVGHVKVGGNYAPVLKFSDEARAQGFHITLHLDSRTQSQIDEFSTSGFLGLKKTGDSFTLVVPSSPSILKSVTSTSCVELAKSFGWAVELRPVCIISWLIFLLTKIIFCEDSIP
jgi:branched-chain amino acid aminotransferase